MIVVLLILFTIVPALEFYLLFTIGSQIGAANTFLIIVSTGMIGAYLAKMQGLSIFMQIQDELNQGKIPGTSMLHGFMIFGGGLLLLTPGFITDFLGLCMVIPGTRHIIVKFAMKYFQQGLASGKIHVFTNMKGFSQKRESSISNPDVIEAEFEKIDDEQN